MYEQEPAPPLFGLKGGILCASVFLGGADLLHQDLSWSTTKIFDALCLFPLRYEQSTEENSAPGTFLWYTPTFASPRSNFSGYC